jgi:AcrR family transcriptional regulator
MATSQPPPRRGRGRPRTPGAEERILGAALEEYGEHGWSGFTMDGVARRAGVGKSTVYLRWQDKDSLLTDAVAISSATIGAVDTGSLRRDLEGLSENLFHYLLDPAGWASLRILIDGAGAAEPLGQFVEAVTQVHVGFVEKTVARAVARGEISDHHPADAIGELVYGSVAMQMLQLRLAGRGLDDAQIAKRVDRLVGILLGGILR